MERQHKTKKIIIKLADVDVNICPVVKWLNSFNGIRTQFSCEGDDDLTRGQKPHVLFHCDNELSLVRVLVSTASWAEFKIQFFEGSIRYEMLFPSKRNLKGFKESMRKYPDKYC
jgi:hypothetical protein